MDLSAVTIDLSTVYAFGVTAVTALAGMIVLRKSIKTVNRV